MRHVLLCFLAALFWATASAKEEMSDLGPGMLPMYSFEKDPFRFRLYQGFRVRNRRDYLNSKVFSSPDRWRFRIFMDALDSEMRKRSPSSDDNGLDVESTSHPLSGYIDSRPAREEGRRYLLWRKITG